MKIDIVAPTAGNIIADDQAIDVTVRVTHDNGAAARNVSLSWRPVARHGQWAQRFTKTDKTGTARNSLTFSCDAQPGAYQVEVSMPGIDMHAIGTIHVLPNQAAMFTPKRAQAALAADAGTLTIVYPPENVLLPVNSPIKVWALYTQSNGSGYDNQPIQFAPGNFTSVVGTPDTQTDADGWATATVQLSKDGTLNTIATFDGSITASIPGSNASASRPLHASTSAGGPGTIKVTKLEFQNWIGNKLWNSIEMQHLLADGTPGKYTNVATEPVTDSGDAHFFEPVRLADSLGYIGNFIQTNLPQGTNVTDVDVTAPNAIAGVDDTADVSIPVLDYLRDLGTSTIEVGPMGQESTDTLPIGVRIQFRAVCRFAGGAPWPQGTRIVWSPQTRGQYGPDFRIQTNIANANGEAFNWVTMSRANEPCYAMALEVGGDQDAAQGLWLGLFYDQANPPFPQFSVRIAPPDNPDVGYGTTATLQTTVLTGRDWLTGLPTTPVPNQTVYWHADPADKVAFSQATGPVSTLPHDEFPTVTNASGNTSVRVSSVGNEAFSATIWCEIHSRDTGTAIESDPPITLEFGDEQKAQIVVTAASSKPSLYGGAPNKFTATYSGPADQMPPQVEFLVDFGSDTTHFIRLSPNPADVNTNQAATNSFAYGPNVDTPATVYARPMEAPGVPPPTDFTLVPAQVTFTSTSQPPKNAVMSADSPDGNPLSLDAWHLLTANLTYYDGTPVPSGTGDSDWDGNIQWSLQNSQQDPSITWLTSDPTPANASGIATNAIKCSADAHQVTVYAAAKTNNGTSLGDQILNLTFQQVVRFEDQGSIAIEFDGDSDQFPLNTPQGLTATYTDSNNHLVDGAWITWTGFPADRLTFANEKTQTVNGVATNTVTASGQSEISDAYISATSFNPLTGANDYGMTSTAFEQTVDALIIYLPSGETEPLTLYDPHELDASYIGSKTLQYVQWSVDQKLYPYNTITFDKNPSPVTSLGNNKYTTNTNITVRGRDAPIDVTVYARSTDPNNFVAGETEHPLRFKAKGTQPPAGNTIVMTSLDGNPLSEGANVWHILQATYIDANGTGIPGATLNWAPTNQAGVTIVPGPQTDSNGVTTAAINVTSAMSVTVTASDNSNTSDSLSLTFQAGTVTLPGQGTMTLVFTDASPPYGLNQTYELTVTYWDGSNKLVPDGTEITWHAFPPDLLTFEQGPTTKVSGGQGQSTNNVTASGDTEIDNVVISTTHFNEDIGVNDHSEPNLVADFIAEPTLIGVLLDKAYAQTPQGTHVKPNNPKQNIKCQVQVEHQKGVQQVTLLTTPSETGAKMFKTDGSGNELDTVNGNYVVNTDPNGIGTFVVGSDGFTLFDLNAQWNNQTLPAPAKLVLATNRQQVNPVVTKPVVPDLHGGTTLTIPPAPAPTFKVQIPNSRYVTPGTAVAVLLNDRLVYDGAAEPALNDGVDVAYAALNLTSANNLVYVAGTALESDQLTFTTTVGTPQTGPNTGGVTRTPDMQIDVKSGQPIGPKDIIDGGLPVVLNVNDSITPNVDVITLYFYLSGTDVLTAKPVTNIVSVVYPVTSDTSFPLTLLLPQQYAAGYANGQLQADYKVVGSTTRWSQLSSTYTLNTTF